MTHDADKAISLMRETTLWMEQKGIQIIKSWQLENLNKPYIETRHKIEPQEYYVFYMDEMPVGACIFQIGDKLHIWPEDKRNIPAVYLYKFCVVAPFKGKGISDKILSKLKEETKRLGIKMFRLNYYQKRFIYLI